MHEKSPREQQLQNNHKHGSRPKEFNRNKDKSNNTRPLQYKISLSRPKINSVRFDDPYEHIHHMENTHEYTHLIDTQEQDM